MKKHMTKEISDTIRKRLKETFSQYDRMQIPRILSHLRPDGSFDDIDYADTSRADWPAFQHIKRTAALACAYSEGNIPADCIHSAAAYWFFRDFQNSNWWFNELGVPQQMRMILLCCPELLSQEVQKGFLDRLQTEIDPYWTATNKLWFAENIIFRGVLTEDADIIRRGRDYIAETIFLADAGDEGIQPDGSFAQHGIQLYNHGYGRTFLTNSCRWFQILHGTPFAFPEEKIQIVIHLFLNGTIKMGRFQTMDFSAQSREIIRCYEETPERTMLAYCKPARILAGCTADKDTREKLLHSVDFIEGKRGTPYGPYNSAFWRLDFMTHQREQFYASTRFASKGVLGGDIFDGIPVNGENVLDGFGAYGTTLYMTSGKEYEKIFPLLDWGCLPGTTTPHIEMPLEIGSVHESEFVGSVSDGLYGIAAGYLKKSNCLPLEDASFGGKKACFFLDEGVVHLGNSLYCTFALPFNTTLNQCNLRGAVYADGKKLENCADFTKVNAAYLYHDRTAYLNLDHAPLLLKTGRVSGSYTRIFRQSSAPKKPVSGETLVLLRPHGMQVSGQAYAYAVMPGVTPETAAQYAANPPFQIIANHTKLQCIGYQERLLCVFYEPGSAIYQNCICAVDRPCFLMLDYKNSVGYLSSPDADTHTVTVTVNQKKHIITLPPAPSYKGKTAEFSIMT